MSLTALAALALIVGACDSDDGGTTTDTSADTTADTTADTAGDTTADTTPADTDEDTGPDDTTDDVADDTMDDAEVTPPAKMTRLIFAVDDSANKTYGDRDLEWKGSFNYDEDTNVLTFDPTWAGGVGPYPPLFDDGPISMGGHEPESATAGDNILSIMVMIETPTDADLTLEYGLQTKAANPGEEGTWVWSGDNGKVVIPVDDEGPIEAQGLTFEAFGTIDLRLDMDTSTIDADFMPVVPGVTSISVKGSAWGWQEVTLLDNGLMGDETALDGVYTYVHSENLAADGGLFKVDDEPEFVWVVGGVEYKDGNSDAQSLGIVAWSNYTDTDTEPTVWSSETIQQRTEGAFGKNTYVQIGGADETTP